MAVMKMERRLLRVLQPAPHVRLPGASVVPVVWEVLSLTRLVLLTMKFVTGRSLLSQRCPSAML
jgi:hypothetical protein